MVTHPADALFDDEEPSPIIPSCEHFAGCERLIRKALQIQHERGGGFDVTMDLEDGAEAGREMEHAKMVADLTMSSSNSLEMTGVRVHGWQHPHARRDVDIVVGHAGSRLAYLTIPKATGAAMVREVASYVRDTAQRAAPQRDIPLHVLIETHGALREVFQIAAIQGVQVLDFGLMDFVSAHHGAIGEEHMSSPGQFDHPLLRRAKAEIAAAALGRSIVASHNVTLDLKNAKQTYDDARRARQELGFLRMWSIHPEQIAPIIEGMRPDFGAVARASDILLRAQAKNWGPIEHAGRLHDRATYRYHWSLLQRAKLAGCLLDSEAEAAFFPPGRSAPRGAPTHRKFQKD